MMNEKNATFWKLLGGGPGPTGPNSCYGPTGGTKTCSSSSLCCHSPCKPLLNILSAVGLTTKGVWVAEVHSSCHIQHKEKHLKVAGSSHCLKPASKDEESHQLFVFLRTSQ